MSDYLYGGNDFSITQHRDTWIIYRFAGDDEVERVVLSTEGMDELRDYFAESYAEHRAEVAAMREP